MNCTSHSPRLAMLRHSLPIGYAAGHPPPPPAVRFQNQIDVRGLDKASTTPDSIAATDHIERARGCFDQNFHPMGPCPPLKKISEKLRFLKKISSN